MRYLYDVKNDDFILDYNIDNEAELYPVNYVDDCDSLPLVGFYKLQLDFKQLSPLYFYQNILEILWCLGKDKNDLGCYVFPMFYTLLQVLLKDSKNEIIVPYDFLHDVLPATSSFRDEHYCMTEFDTLNKYGICKDGGCVNRVQKIIITDDFDIKQLDTCRINNVYRISFPDGRVYIGRCKGSIKKRFSNGNGYRGNPKMYKEIKRVGVDSLKIECLHSNLLDMESRLLEIDEIRKHKSRLPQYGFNRSPGGE